MQLCSALHKIERSLQRFATHASYLSSHALSGRVPVAQQPSKTRILLESAGKFANTITDRTNFAWHAFDEIWPTRLRLDCSRTAGTVCEQQITVSKSPSTVSSYDLVVSMVFALVVKTRSQGVDNVQSACDDLCHPLGR